MKKIIKIFSILSPVIAWTLFIFWVCYIFGGMRWLNIQLPNWIINLWFGITIFIAGTGSVLCWYFFKKNSSELRFLYFFMLLPNVYLCLFIIGGTISCIHPSLHWIQSVVEILFSPIGWLWFICLLVYLVWFFRKISSKKQNKN
jgi:hypothetical protein